MHIYPEGATGNGVGGLLKFKKGAFASLRAVQPLCITYWTPRLRYSHGDSTNFWHYVVVIT